MLTLLAAAVVLAAPAEPRDAEALHNAVRAPSATVKLPRTASFTQEADLRSAGLARTAVEHRADDATLALGFLCGREPGAGRTGAAATHGYDPAGRFVGAKLSFAFR